MRTRLSRLTALAITILVFSACGQVPDGGSPVMEQPPVEPTPDATVTEPLPIDASPTVPPAPTCLALPNGIAAWWRGENTTADAIGGHPGTVYGGATFGAGKVGQSLVFDGYDDHVDVPHADGLYPGGSFSYEAWIKTTAQSGTIVSIRACGGPECHANSWAELLLGEGGKLSFWVRGRAFLGAQQTLTSKTSISDGAPHHIVAVKDRDRRKLFVYVDGNPDGDADLQPAADDALTPDEDDDPLLVGARLGSRKDEPPYLNYFAGAIDELSLYLSALTNTQVRALYAAGAEGKCVPR